MLETIQANGPAFALALVAVLLVGWWLLRRGSQGARRREYKPDVLDQGAASVHRNQALIDSTPAARIVPPPMAGTLGGIGEVIAVAAQDEVEEAEAEQAAPEPIPVPEEIPAPQPEPESVTAPAADDLSRIKGLGPKLQALLTTLGLSTYAQIAALSEADLAELDAKLGAFAGRPAKDNWVEQAKYLAAGDVAGFEARFGKV